MPACGNEKNLEKKKEKIIQVIQHLARSLPDLRWQRSGRQVKMPACECLNFFHKTRGLKRKNSEKMRENNTSHPALGSEFTRLQVAEVGQAG